MKTQSASLVAWAATTLAIFALSGLAFAAESADSPSPEAVSKIMEEAGKPVAEHKRLEPLVGEWTYTSKLWMDPAKPPIETSGTIERKCVLGGLFVEECIKGKGPDGKTDFEGRGVIGYDKAQKHYTYGWICSMTSGITTSVGTSDESGKHFTFKTEAYCPVIGRKVPVRDELRIESDDRHVYESYMTLDGKENKVMEFTAVRKKD